MTRQTGHTFVPTVPEGCDLDKERILLHCCCAPCSTAIIEWMVSEGLKPGLFFSNSNIVPHDEYVLRREELRRYAESFGLEVFDDDYDHEAWLEAVKGLEHERERGPRCLECFKFRLLRAARFASTHGYTLLGTTLASSRWKSLEQVDEAGRWAVGTAGYETGAYSVCSGTGETPVTTDVVWWGQNWRKGGLQERRNCLIKEKGMYNQNWCGCEFSHKDKKEEGNAD